MLIIARIDFILEICLIHSHAANGLLESRSRTKSHCPALHKHARTHMQTHTRISLSLLSVLSLQRVSPRCRTQIWKVTACRPCRQRNVSWPIRRGSVPTVSLNNQLQSGCWKHQKKKSYRQKWTHRWQSSCLCHDSLSLKLRDSANWTEANGKHC